MFKMELEKQEISMDTDVDFCNPSHGGLELDLRSDDSLAPSEARSPPMPEVNVPKAITLVTSEMALINKHRFLENQFYFAQCQIDCAYNEMKFSGSTEAVDVAMMAVYRWLREVSRVHVCISSEFLVDPTLFSDRAVSKISEGLQQNLVCIERCNNHVPANDCLVLVFHESLEIEDAVQLTRQLIQRNLGSGFIPVLDKTKMKYLRLKFSNEIKQLERNKLDGEVKISDDDRGYKLQFFGSAGRFQMVKERLHQIIGGVKHSKYIRKLCFKSNKLKTYISGVEQTNDVSVFVFNIYGIAPACKGMNYCKEVAVVHGIIISIVEESITDQKVDVIVNSANRDLVYNRADINRAVFERVGQKLVDVCKKKKSLAYKELFKTDGFNLPCQCIYHVEIMDYIINNPRFEEGINNFFSTCLEKASDEKFHSIAFPPIACGIYRTHKDLIIKSFYKGCEEFAERHCESTLKEIRFAILSGSDLVEGFVQQMKMLVSDAVTPWMGKNSLEFNIYGTDEKCIDRARTAIIDYYDS